MRPKYSYDISTLLFISLYKSFTKFCQSVLLTRVKKNVSLPFCERDSKKQAQFSELGF